jgi:hypothetical protein
MHIDCRPGLVACMANVFKRAFCALWIACNADSAAVVNDLVRKVGPLLLWYHLHQVLLDPDGVVIIRELKATRDSVHMGVDDHANILAKP